MKQSFKDEEPEVRAIRSELATFHEAHDLARRGSSAERS